MEVTIYLLIGMILQLGGTLDKKILPPKMDKKPPTHTQQPQPTHPKMDKVPPTDTQQRAPRLG